jgi:PhzF family phenazine biosynthesis protein
MIPYYQAQAFTDRVDGGNPAGVCVLDRPLDTATMQAIAAEIGLSETAFVVAGPGDARQLRWFTPVHEVDLCGHATLATAHVLWRERGVPDVRLVFATQSGPVTVTRDDPWLELDFPARPARPCAAPEGLQRALGCSPVAVGASRDLVVELADARAVRQLDPDQAALATLDAFAVCVTARGDRPGVDFVSRFFAPREGIPEDPVTGSAHCTLVPWWADRLGRTELVAHQVSARGGEIRCRLEGDRVRLRGQAVTWLAGELRVAQPDGDR